MFSYSTISLLVLLLLFWNTPLRLAVTYLKVPNNNTITMSSQSSPSVPFEKYIQSQTFHGAIAFLRYYLQPFFQPWDHLRACTNLTDSIVTMKVNNFWRGKHTRLSCQTYKARSLSSQRFPLSFPPSVGVFCKMVSRIKLLTPHSIVRARAQRLLWHKHFSLQNKFMFSVVAGVSAVNIENGFCNLLVSVHCPNIIGRFTKNCRNER